MNLTPPQPLTWPPKRVGELLDYSLDLSRWLADASDTILSVTASASPSEAGDLALSGVSAVGSVITLWAGAGLPGTFYAVELDVRTTAGRIIVPIIGLMVFPGGTPSTAVPIPASFSRDFA